jgi:hypothetical protein
MSSPSMILASAMHDKPPMCRVFGPSSGWDTVTIPPPAVVATHVAVYDRPCRDVVRDNTGSARESANEALQIQFSPRADDRKFLFAIRISVIRSMTFTRLRGSECSWLGTHIKLGRFGYLSGGNFIGCGLP